MKIAVLSGKGGTGKTFIAVNLAAAAKKAVYLDCDTEEPNGRLFFRQENIISKPVYTLLPGFDGEKCTGCKSCVSHCRFNALVFVKGRPMVFPEVCHSCGLCSEVCPAEAVKELPHEIGRIETGFYKDIRVITGILNFGEASGVPVIRAVKKEADKTDFVIADCPPGSSCSVTESIEDADFCIFAAEPTAFGLHNLKMVYRLVSLLGKKSGAVINKLENRYEPLENFCRENSIPVLGKIPYSINYARTVAAGGILCEKDAQAAALFADILKKTEAAAL